MQSSMRRYKGEERRKYKLWFCVCVCVFVETGENNLSSDLQVIWRCISTCSWNSCNYVGLLQWLADRLTAESAGVERAQEGYRAAAQIVCWFVIRHRGVWQHSHIQLSLLQTVKHLQEKEKHTVRQTQHHFHHVDHPEIYLQVWLRPL